jgi:hypothetical protein
MDEEIAIQATVGQETDQVSGTHEFDEQQNAKIQKLSRRSRLWGTLAVAGGGIGLLGVLGALVFLSAIELPPPFPPRLVGVVFVGFIPLLLVQMLAGVLFMRAGDRFRLVVETQGDDVALVMGALEYLGRAFRIESIVAVVGVLIAVGAVVLGLSQGIGA